MGYTIPNDIGLTYTGQGKVDSVDLAILTAGIAGCNVASGCATTATGSSMVLTVASGQARLGPGVNLSVLGNTVTIATAHASLNRYDLVVLAASGTATSITGTAASTPVFPTFDPTTQVPLYAVYVPAAATTLATANLVDKRVIVAGTPGVEIDTGARATMFDVQAVGTTQTEVSGLRVIIPPQQRPYRLTVAMPIQFVSGTAAIVAQHQVNVQIQDVTGTAAVVGFNSAGYVQVTAASKTVTVPLAIDVRFDANTVTKTYIVSAALQSAAAANWTSTKISAGDLPTAGEVFPPVNLIAVSL